MSHFDAWYADRHGYPPFPWQTRLAERLAADDWPEALTPPTGCGKTAIIDIWLWARLQGLPVPRRLVYVIDRRLVVDGVTDYAQTLAASLEPDARPSVVTMRGGLSIEDDWLTDPLRPAVLVSTVDQVGSRLLFSGYGVNPKVAPSMPGCSVTMRCWCWMRSIWRAPSCKRWRASPNGGARPYRCPGACCRCRPPGMARTCTDSMRRTGRIRFCRDACARPNRHGWSS